MEKSTIVLFTSPTCPHCPGARKIIEEIGKERTDIDIFELSTSTQEGFDTAMKFNVHGVPTIFIKGPNKEETFGFVGIPSKNSINKAINLSLGKG